METVISWIGGTQLADTHKKTVFVWGQAETEGKTIIKGSCRSAHCDVFSLMKNTPDIFAEAGGHKNAGGFTLNDGAEVFFEEVINKTEGIHEDVDEKHLVDSECTIDEVVKIHTLHEQFAPFV